MCQATLLELKLKLKEANKGLAPQVPKQRNGQFPVSRWMHWRSDWRVQREKLRWCGAIPKGLNMRSWNREQLFGRPEFLFTSRSGLLPYQLTVVWNGFSEGLPSNLGR